MDHSTKSFLRHTVQSLKPAWSRKPSSFPGEVYEVQVCKGNDAQLQAAAAARSAFGSPEPANRPQMQQNHREGWEVHPQNHSPSLLHKPSPAEPTEKRPRRRRFGRRRTRHEHERRKEREPSVDYGSPPLPQVPNTASSSVSSEGSEPLAVEDEEESENIASRVQSSQDNRFQEENQELRKFLNRMFQLLYNGKTKYPSIQFEQEIVNSFTLQTIEKAFVDIFESYGQRIRELDASESRAERVVKNYKSLKNAHDGLKSEKDDLVRDNDDLIRENKDLTQKISIMGAEAAKQATNEKVGNAKLEGRLSNMEDLYSSQQEKYDARVAKIQADNQSERDKLQVEYQSEKGKDIIRIERLEADVLEMRRKCEDKIQDLKVDHSKDMAIARQSSEEAKKVADNLLEKKKREHGERLAMLTREHENALAAQSRDFDNKLIQYDLENKRKLEEAGRISSDKLKVAETHYEDILKELKSTLACLESTHLGEMTDLEGQKQLELDDLNAQLSAKNEEIMTQKQDFIMQLEAKERRMAEKEQIYKREIAEMKQAHERKIAEMEQAHERERSKMVQKHRDDKEEHNIGIRKTVEALKEALVARESFSTMSDHELKNRFRDIAVEVSELARIRWDEKKASSWPFSGEHLEKLRNERRTKKNLIQNNLWVIIYEGIFCTPFRVLGKEGKILENEWLHQPGDAQNYKVGLARCPQPNKESERWRYETMKSCIIVTGDRLAEGDPSFSLQQNYYKALEDIRNDIMQELGKVSTEISCYEDQVETLLREAAKFWLEVGQQRCRMFLAMSESGTEPAQTRLNHCGTLNLVVMPQLRRMGNAFGEQLDKDELVLEGNFSVFPTT
ncbi:hypothetical protein BGZ60DRAFT_425926 [Tricladium varicosporioides]|nr:hypothetical protein BGZ60DRAFT_425926 [Hymenoscyphus varicosporioides]